METNIQGLCRVCTNRNIEMISIYEHYMFYEQCLQIFKVIGKCASIQIQKHDGFSEHICKSCMEHLCQAYGFKQLCEDSDYKFRNNLVVGDTIVPQGAYCDNVIKIQSADEINEKIGYTNDVSCEIKSEIYEDETKIEYGVVENQIQEENVERASIDFTLQNLKCELSPSLHEIKPILGEDTKIHWINDNNFDVKSKETEISNKLQEFTTDFSKDDLSSFRETELPIISGENPYKCEECGECFTRKINLRVHKKIHTEEKVFKCEPCNIYFGEEQALNDHNNFHMGDVVLKSVSRRGQVCLIVNNYKFTFKCNLRSGEKSWRCRTPKCLASISTVGEEYTIVKRGLVHNHTEMSASEIQKETISVYAKRKAVEDISSKPNEILQQVLPNDIASDGITCNDLINIKRKMYNARKKLLSQLPSMQL